jgi:hypothetical protein
MSKLSVLLAHQGCIWPETAIVKAEYPNLVVLWIGTQQKYVSVLANVAGRTEGSIILTADKHTLALREGADPKDDTLLVVKGLHPSNLWHASYNEGRYGFDVMFYRHDPNRKQRHLPVHLGGRVLNF